MSFINIILFEMVEKPVFDLKIKHVPSAHGCGDEQFCGNNIFANIIN